MTELRRAAEMALEAMELLDRRGGLGMDVHEYIRSKIEALRQALAQPVDAVNTSQERVDETAKREHEPAAWITDGGKGELWWYQSSKYDEEGTLIGPNPDDVPLYTAPPKREWVGLTEYQRLKFADRFHISGESIEAIEAKLKEKNT